MTPRNRSWLGAGFAAALAGAFPARAEDGPVCRPPPEPTDELICAAPKDAVGDLLRILEPLWENSGYGRPVRLYFLEEAVEANAVAMEPLKGPNKEDIAKIGVTMGMWHMMRSDDERAFVLAHEMSHLVALDVSHILKLAEELVPVWIESPEAKKTWKRLSAQKLSDEKKTERLVDRFNQAVMNPEKRKVESYADINAMNLMRLAGYDVGAAVAFLERIRRHYPEQDVLDINSDHPAVSRRIEVAEGMLTGYTAGNLTEEHPDASGIRTGKKKGVDSKAAHRATKRF